MSRVEISAGEVKLLLRVMKRKCVQHSTEFDDKITANGKKAKQHQKEKMVEVMNMDVLRRHQEKSSKK